MVTTHKKGCDCLECVRRLVGRQASPGRIASVWDVKAAAAAKRYKDKVGGGGATRGPSRGR